MAARLNTPADFLLPPKSTAAANVPQGDLLPPSVFETPLTHSLGASASGSKGDPRQELSEATAQILDLKSQIQRLKESRHVTFTHQEPIKAQVDIHHQQPSATEAQANIKDVAAISLGHMDEIIQRQAADIVELKQKLVRTEAEKHREEADRESKRKLHEASQQQQISALEAEISNLRGQHSDQIKRINLETENVIEDKNRKIIALEENLKTSQELFQHEISQLNTQLGERERRCQQVEEEFQRTRLKNEEEIRELKKQTAQLKTYVAETENNYKSTDTWRREVENLSSKLKLKEDEISSLQQNLELCHLRQEAQNRMLSLQEQQLSKVKHETLDKKRNILLTRWREKVYELMVQAKSTEISHRHQEHNWRLKLQYAEEQLEAAASENRVKKAEVEDKEAQLNLSQHQIKNLNIEITRAQDVALSLDKMLSDAWNHLQQLKQVAQRIYAKYEETLGVQEHIESALKSYDQRISFAAGRVFMLQSQFARKEALLKLEYEEPIRDKESQLPSQVEQSENDALKLELARLTDERDILSRQLQQDSQLLEHKVNQAKKEVESQLQELENNVQGLNVKLDSKNRIIDDLEEQCAVLKQEVEVTKEELEQREGEYKEILTNLEKELASKNESEREEFREQLGEMERRMNDARREQTKAVVSLRQLERSTARSKEQTNELMSEMEKGYKEAILKLEQKLRHAEKDRNLLMATLRQEGLIGQYKAKRSDPALPDFGLSESTDLEESVTEAWKATQSSVPESDSEPLHNVIDDLKTLTADVIDEEDDVLEAL